MKDPCRNCPGLCCLLKDNYGDFSVATKEYCPQHRFENGVSTCKIYGKHTGTRTGDGILCLSVEDMIKAGLAPLSCSYVKNLPNYRTRVLNYDEIEKEVHHAND